MAGQHIDDLKRDWLLRQISFQDRQEELLDNELRISDIKYANLIQLGTVYNFDFEFTLGAGITNTISFTTTTVPVVIYQALMQFTGTATATIQGFAGGAVSGGSEITEVFPNNHDNPGQSPWVANSVFEGRTIDSPGVEFIDASYAQASRNDLSANEAGGLILAEDQLYYFTITNTGAQSGDFVFAMTAGANI